MCVCLCVCVSVCVCLWVCVGGEGVCCIICDKPLLESGKRASYLVGRTGRERTLKREVHRAFRRVRRDHERLARIGIYRGERARLRRFKLVDRRAKLVLGDHLQIDIYR